MNAKIYGERKGKVAKGYLFCSARSSVPPRDLFFFTPVTNSLLTCSHFIFQRQWRSVCTLGIAGVIMLILRLQGNTPQFSTADNPTAKDPRIITRFLTFAYLPVFNFWLLLFPNTLSFDWGMDAIPRITSIRDPRNLCTLAFYVTIFVLSRRCFWKLLMKTTRKVKAVREEKSWICPCPVCYQSLSDIHSASCRTTNNNNSVSSHSLCVCIALPPTIRFRSSKTHQKPSCSAAVLMGISLLMLPFLPATNLLFYVGFVVAERVLYLPSAGLCLLLGMGCAGLWESRKFRKLSGCLLFILLVVFSARTVLRNRDWSNEESLYRSALHVNPPKGKNLYLV